MVSNARHRQYLSLQMISSSVTKRGLKTQRKRDHRSHVSSSSAEPVRIRPSPDCPAGVCSDCPYSHAWFSCKDTPVIMSKSRRNKSFSHEQKATEERAAGGRVRIFFFSATTPRSCSSSISSSSFSPPPPPPPTPKNLFFLAAPAGGPRPCTPAHWFPSQSPREKNQDRHMRSRARALRGIHRRKKK